MQPDLVNYWSARDETYRFDIFVTDDFSCLQQVGTVNGLVLNLEQTHLLMVRLKSGEWILPGGGVEAGESLLETLIREVKEETNRSLQLETVKPLFYQHVYVKNPPGKWEFIATQVRYSAVAADDCPFIADPDQDIVETRWVPIARLEDYLNWGATTRFIQKLLLNPKISIGDPESRAG